MAPEQYSFTKIKEKEKNVPFKDAGHLQSLHQKEMKIQISNLKGYLCIKFLVSLDTSLNSLDVMVAGDLGAFLTHAAHTRNILIISDVA